MSDTIGPVDVKKKPLLEDVRPGSSEVTGQQRELFPFDAFKYTSELSGAENVVSLEDGWELDGGSLKNESVETEAVAAEAITSDKIAVEAVTADKIDVASLFAEDITITGSISSSNYSAGVAGFKIDGPAGSIDIVDGTFSGSIDIGGGAFSVTSAGEVTATSGTFSGDITGASGTFSGSVGIGIGDSSFKILEVTVV